MGVYPMLLDETCHFLAVDFDGPTWAADARAYLDACAALDVPAALERSRSGVGGHVWIFFDDALPASVARRLGALLLTEAMDKRPDLGFRSYDRFFPSQDILPRGGFGNLIALPLQRRPRRVGNSVFVDQDLVPFQDQWAFLAALRRMTQTCAESLVRAAESKGRVVGVRAVAEEDAIATSPWLAPPSRRQPMPHVVGTLPETLELTLGDRVYIAKAGLPPALVTRLTRLGAFQNPEFYRAQAMRLPTYDKPRIVDCVEDGPTCLGLPRGCLEDAQELLNGLGIRTSVTDQRSVGRPLPVAFGGELRPDQEAAGRALAAHDTGVLAAATAFGKTVVAAWLIAERAVNTLVVVHREQLLQQWMDRLSEFLDVGNDQIGCFTGRRKKGVRAAFSRRVIVWPTGFRAVGEPDSDPRAEFQRLCSQLMSDAGRNKTICHDIVAEAREGRSPLVLTERVDHFDELAGLVANAEVDVVSLPRGAGPSRSPAEGSCVAAWPPRRCRPNSTGSGAPKSRRWYSPPAVSSARGSTRLISTRCS